MTKDKSNSGTGGKVIKKLTLPDGFRVGIVDLDDILKKVSDLRLVDATVIKEELVKRVEIVNYVPSDARTDYSKALFQEYQIKYGDPKETENESKIQFHKHTKG